MTQKHLSKAGLTITEVLVALGIISFIFAGVFGVLIGSQGSWSVTEAKMQANEQLRLALLKIAKELRQSGAEKIEIYDFEPSDLVRFQLPLDLNADGKYDYDSEGNLIWGAGNIEGGNIFYHVDQNNKTLLRSVATSEGSSTDTLATNISQLNCVSDSSGVVPQYLTITLTAEVQVTGDKNITAKKEISLTPKN